MFTASVGLESTNLIMSFKTLFSAGLLLGPELWQAHAYLVDPPTKADPKTVSDCSNWVTAASGDKCDVIASQNGISVSDFDVYVSSNKRGGKLPTTRY